MVLCWHVDYWDYIGWKDPFARKAFSERQRTYRKLREMKQMGTPQVFVQNEAIPWTKGWLESVPERVTKAGKTDATLSIDASAVLREGKIRVSVGLTRLDDEAKALPRTVGVVPVLYRRYAKTSVPKGENEGKTLEEWHIALDALDALPVADALADGVTAAFALPEDTKPADLGVAILVEDAATLRTLECVAVPVTAPAAK